MATWQVDKHGWVDPKSVGTPMNRFLNDHVSVFTSSEIMTLGCFEDLAAAWDGLRDAAIMFKVMKVVRLNNNYETAYLVFSANGIQYISQQYISQHHGLAIPLFHDMSGLFAYALMGNSHEVIPLSMSLLRAQATWPNRRRLQPWDRDALAMVPIVVELVRGGRYAQLAEQTELWLHRVRMNFLPDKVFASSDELRRLMGNPLECYDESSATSAKGSSGNVRPAKHKRQGGGFVSSTQHSWIFDQ